MGPPLLWIQAFCCPNTSTGDLERGDRIHLSAGFQAFVPFPPFPRYFLVQLLRVASSACSHVEITPGQQEDKQTGRDVT